MSMKKMRKDIEISDLIYKSLRKETSKDEEALLEAWCLDTKNRELFMKLRDADYLYKDIVDISKVDTELPFKKVEERIKKKKRLHGIAYISGIAAVLLVGVVLIFPFLEEQKTERNVLFPTSIGGTDMPSAKLVTTAGKVVFLEDSVKQLAYNEKNEKELTRQPEEETLPLEVTPLQEVEYNVLTTSKQGSIRVMLYDGSHVWLNAGSELKYPNSYVGNKRIVYLKGEAFFEVAKDTLHPFIVNTASAEINVLGTSFNVNAYNASCATTLVEGRVRMKSGNIDSVELRPGQQAFIANGGSIDVRKVDTRYYTGWVDNLFTFWEVPLREIMNELEKWYGCTSRFEDAKLENIMYTTMVKRYPDIDGVLRILSGTGDFRYIRIDNMIIIKEK